MPLDPIPRPAVDPMTMATSEAFDYFAVAQSKSYNKQWIKSGWYVVHAVCPAGYQLITAHISRMLTLQSTDPKIRSRFRHPSGRLFFHEEAVLVVNELNHRYRLSRIMAQYYVGGLSKLVRIASIDVLGIETTTIEE